MYTLSQIEKVSIAIHNQATENASSEARMKVIARIHLNMLMAGHTQVEKETLAEEEITMIDHYLKDNQS